MSWTDVFPLFTEEMVDEFHEQATSADKDLLEEWYGIDRIINPLPHLQEVVSLSLFWKNVHEGDPELPTPTRERLQNAVDLGLSDRFNPWEHYVKPLLNLTPSLREKFPNTSIRVHLAQDLEFLVEELVAAGCEVYLMKSSSINFAPGGLWRFLPFEEEGKTVVVANISRLNELESDLARTRTMDQAGVGAWRIPIPQDLNNQYQVSYLPFRGCQFGTKGGLLNARELLDAFTWHACEDKLDPNVIYPDCGPLPLRGNRWPSYGFDEYFLSVVAYPRLAQNGILTFIPSGSSSMLLSLDVEYCTWANSASELVFCPTGKCCGGEGIEAIPEVEVVTIDELPTHREIPIAQPADKPREVEIKVALLFLTKGEVHHPKIWRDYLEQAGDQIEVYAHVKHSDLLDANSFLHPFEIEEKIETEWASPSLVAATLALLRTALSQGQATHFILVSESCIPVRPFNELLFSLKLDPRSRTNYEPWSELRKRNVAKAQRAENIEFIRPEIAYFQDQWMLLSREASEIVTSKDHLKSFDKVFAADECYFMTVLSLKGFSIRENVINKRLTWALWNAQAAHPRTHERVNPEVAAQISESGSFFARKFAPNSNIADYGLHLKISDRLNPADSMGLSAIMPEPEKQDRAQITYQQTSGGRSGHQLKDLFTSVILGELFNLETFFGDSWQKQSLLSNIPPIGTIPSQTIRLNIKRQAWDGISFEEFQKISRTIEPRRGDDTLFVFSGVCRIHLCQLHEWELADKIAAGTFDSCLKILRNLYWGKNGPSGLRNGEVAIHARRGDVADPNHHEYNEMGPGAWDASFYQEKINQIKERFNPSQITIYSEEQGSEDLKTLKGVTLDLGGTKELDRHLREMVSAEYFMPSCSSLSTWAAYISHGTILISDKKIKHFEHPSLLANWLHL